MPVSLRVRWGWRLSLALAVAAPGIEAQTGVGPVAGRVVDRTTFGPVEGATVRVDGGAPSTITDAEGRFRLESVAPGAVRLHVSRLGYEALTVDVGPGTEARLAVEVLLAPRALRLDRLVATVTGPQRARSVAHDVTRIDVPREIERTGARSVAELVRTRVPGVHVLSSSGTVGSGTRIRVRGSGSINLPNDPVVFVDGARVDTDPLSGSIDVGGQVPSRLDDLDPEEIESIEVVRGPSAATLYGTDAARGVVRVSTRRGRPGPPRTEAWLEAGAAWDPHRYPDNYFGLTADGQECFVFMVALGLCAQDGQRRANPLMNPESTPFRTAGRGQVGVRVAGGSERTDYFVLGSLERVGGVLELPDFDRRALRRSVGEGWDALPESQFHPNHLERLNLRANLGMAFGETTTLRLHSGLLRSVVRLPQNDNTFLGVLPSGLLGSADGRAENRYGYGFFVPSDIYAMAVSQKVDRLISSARLEGRPRAWLHLRALAGLDLVLRTDEQAVPRDRVLFGSVLPLGVRDVHSARVRTTSLEAGATATWSGGHEIGLRTTLGAQFVGRAYQRIDAHGEDLPPGSVSIADAAITTSTETRADARTLGVYLEQEVAWRDRVHLTGALRADDNSAFGSAFDAILYPKVGVSWVAVDREAEGRTPGRLGGLRLRAAWGESGAQPAPGDALQGYDARSVAVDGGERLGLSLTRPGNPDLRPERASEVEAGFDLQALHDRVSLSLTAYHQTTRDLIVAERLPPSAGAGAQRLVNLGRVRNRGVEALVRARLVERDRWWWEVVASGSLNGNRLVSLGHASDGSPTPSIVQGLQRFVEGYPLAGYWDRPLGVDDRDGDGLVHPEEVFVGVEPRYLGSPIPTREFSLSSTLDLYDGRVVLGAVLEHRGGHHLRNHTEILRCQATTCRGYNDPDASLRDQARALTQTVLSQGLSTEAGFVEDASFWKLREVGISWRAPRAWAARAGAGSLVLSVTGTNLATWTGYSGVDPEVNQQAQRAFLTRDLFTQPPVRSVGLRVQAAF